MIPPLPLRRVVCPRRAGKRDQSETPKKEGITACPVDEGPRVEWAGREVCLNGRFLRLAYGGVGVRG